MNLAQLIGAEYSPTSAFSFEFRKRDPITKELIPIPAIGEIFFLLPPEEYSMTEGYKVTLTKTAAGGWIDDFGNDFKKLRISGSLYSYYKGFPAKPVTGLEKMVNEAKNTAMAAGASALNSMTAGMVNIPGFGGLSGLDEFFQLRYIVSRFRDKYADPWGYRTAPSPNTEGAKLVDGLITNTGMRRLWDAIAIIYHDYDDNNHFEVIFDNFTMRRSKDDPYTVNYNIEMTCVKEWGGEFLGLGKIPSKENPSVLMSEVLANLGELMSSIVDITNIPNQLLNTLDILYNSIVSLYDEFVKFTNRIATNWDQFISRISNVEVNLEDFSSKLFVVTSGGKSIDDLKNETEDLSSDVLNIETVMNELRQILKVMKGTEKYYSSQEQENIFDISERELSDNNFAIDAKEDQGNIFISRGKEYYTVRQNDTLGLLANQFYGDYEKSTFIAKANGLSNSDFENDAMVGENIIIPFEYSSSENLLNNNMIYSKRLEQSTLRERQLQILGNDIKLNSNREIVADGTGDIAMVYGEDAYLANINDRISFPQGTLNPLHPDWGVTLSIGTAQGKIALTKLLDNIDSQLKSDPRTQIGYVDRTTLEIEADKIYIPTKLKPFSGETSTINLGNSIAGLFQ